MISLGTTVATARLRAGAAIRRRQVTNAVDTPDDLKTRRKVTTSSFFPEEHVIRRGYPFKPTFLISSDYLISSSGEYVPDRIYPWDAVFDGSHTRFIATDSFNSVSGRWLPLYTEGIDYSFEFPTIPSPYLNEIEYQLGKEFYTTNSIRIVPGSYLVSNFNNDLDDASSFMIAMAGIIYSTEKSTILSVGITAGTSIEISADEYFYIRNQYDTTKMETPVHPSRMIPFYMLLINDTERTELRVGTGPNRINRILLPNQSASRDLKLRIGTSDGGTPTLDADIFELTVFPYAYGGDMDPDQVINKMAAIYGAGS